MRIERGWGRGRPRKRKDRGGDIIDWSRPSGQSWVESALGTQASEVERPREQQREKEKREKKGTCCCQQEQQWPHGPALELRDKLMNGFRYNTHRK